MTKNEWQPARLIMPHGDDYNSNQAGRLVRVRPTELTEKEKELLLPRRRSKGCFAEKFYEAHPDAYTGDAMLKKSEKFGTELIVGPRLKKFIRAGYGDALLWKEKYPTHEYATNDGRGEFWHTREMIENETLEKVFDLYLRGQDLMGFSEKLLKATKEFRRICK